jgi:hypothetical protein
MPSKNHLNTSFAVLPRCSALDQAVRNRALSCYSVNPESKVTNCPVT